MAHLGFAPPAIRKKIVDSNWLHAVVQMPPHIFANTGTNVSVVFIDKSRKTDKTILVDASKLGTKVKEGKNQKTLLSSDDENKIIDTINSFQSIEGFSIILDTDKIKSKKYSFAAGQYFETKIEYSELSPDEFEEVLTTSKESLELMFKENEKLEKTILNNFKLLSYE